MIDGHGDDIFSFNGAVRSNFSTNIPRKNLQPLQDFLVSHLGCIASYPEPDANSFATVLASQNGVATDNLCITNGATEAIYLIAQAWHGANSVVLAPTFREYQDACTLHAHTVQFARSIDEISFCKSVDLVWICNPNNPTGEIHPLAKLRGLMEAMPHTTFVFDQSYSHFTRHDTFELAEVCNFPNAIILGSMTKEYAIPGLRLGYLCGNGQLCQKVKAFRMPWSVNQLAVEAGKFVLHHKSLFTFDLDNYLSETQWLKAELAKLPGVEVLPTETNFFLCKLRNNGTAEQLKQYLLQRNGILIRNASNFWGLTDKHFRIATQTHSENIRLTEAIKEWIHI